MPEIGWDIDIDARDAIRELDRLDGKADTTQRGVGGSFGKIGTAAKGFLGGIAVREVFQLGAELDAVGRKARLWELQADTAFGAAADSVTAWAETNRREFGATTRELEGLAAGVGTTVRAFGLSEQEAAAFSTELVTLAANLALVNPNVESTEAAVDKLGAALRGEFDSLEAVGIAIKQADVNARLLATGQGELEGAALKAAQAQAVLELATEQAALQFGNMDDEAIQAARDMNSLESDFKSAKEEIGLLVADGVDNLAGSLVALIGWIDVLSGKLDEITGKAGFLKTVFQAASPGFFPSVQGLLGSPSFGSGDSGQGPGGGGKDRPGITINAGVMVGGSAEAGRQINDALDAYQRQTGPR